MSGIPASDCRYFLGIRPCGNNQVCNRLCPEFRAFSHRTLIIKLGAIGDVIRTTPLIRRIKRMYPDGHVTWVTLPVSAALLSHVREIDRVIPLDEHVFQRLLPQRFDLLICLDKEPEAAGLSCMVTGTDKKGFRLNENGNLDIWNDEAAELLRLGVDDQLKFCDNRKSIVQLNFEAMGWHYEQEEYLIEIPEADKEYGRQLVSRALCESGETREMHQCRIIGINPGSGDRFRTKRWPWEQAERLAELLAEKGWHSLLLGGPAERECLSSAAHRLRSSGFVHSGGSDNTLSQFAGIINACHMVVTVDTLALHLAVAARVPVLALFGATSPEEIELYGRGIKYRAPVNCPPCYRSLCPEPSSCMNSITPESVLEMILKIYDDER